MKCSAHAPTGRMRRFAWTSILAIGCAGFAVTGSAETKSASFGVSATVTKACNVSGTALGFGTVDTLSGSNIDATSTLTATCTAGGAFTIGLGAGSGPGATTTARKLTQSADSTKTLSYILSATSAGGANWGGVSETGGASGSGSGTGQAITVYGRIPAGQTSATMGLYSDAIIATIDF